MTSLPGLARTQQPPRNARQPIRGMTPGCTSSVLSPTPRGAERRTILTLMQQPPGPRTQPTREMSPFRRARVRHPSAAQPSPCDLAQALRGFWRSSAECPKPSAEAQGFFAGLPGDWVCAHQRCAMCAARWVGAPAPYRTRFAGERAEGRLGAPGEHREASEAPGQAGRVCPVFMSSSCRGAA